MGGFEFQLNDALKYIKKIHKAKIKLTNGKPNTFWRHISKLTLHITSTAKQQIKTKGQHHHHLLQQQLYHKTQPAPT